MEGIWDPSGTEGFISSANTETSRQHGKDLASWCEMNLTIRRLQERSLKYWHSYLTDKFTNVALKKEVLNLLLSLTGLSLSTLLTYSSQSAFVHLVFWVSQTAFFLQESRTNCPRPYIINRDKSRTGKLLASPELPFYTTLTKLLVFLSPTWQQCSNIPTSHI